MKSKSTKFVLLPLAALALLTGCSSLKNDVAASAAIAGDQISASREALRESIVSAEKARVAAQDVNKPFIAGNSMPLAREVAMPEILRKRIPVTALFSREPVDLALASRQLSDATGISITTTSDALLPPAAFAPRIGTTTPGAPIQAPARVMVQAQNLPLWTILDDIARQASVSWRPVPGGAQFYRVETKVFYLSAIPQSATSTASLGRNAGGNALFDSQSKSSFETKDQNLIRGITSTVEAMLSLGGRATVSPENQTLIVTDTKDSLDRVEAFLKEQNKIMSRRVRVLIEAIEVVDKNSSEIGVDWTILYKTASDSLTINPLASLVATQAANLTAVTKDGNGAGSSALIKALNDVGVVVNRRSFPFLTTSGRPVTQALRSTFSYVDQVQATTVASSTLVSSPAPTVTQKDETVGTFVTLVPTAKNDGTVFLSVSFDITTAQPLVPFQIGTGASAVSVQQKTIDGTGVIQEVPIRSGQTVVIGGIETMTNQSNARRLGADVSLFFGGSNTAKTTKSRMILLVTAVIEEGV
jgi:type IVB pilus formation R64 PilN family outer membrane protein